MKSHFEVVVGQQGWAGDIDEGAESTVISHLFTVKIKFRNV